MKKGPTHVFALAVLVSWASAFAQSPADTAKMNSPVAGMAPQAGVTAKGGGAFIKSEDGRAVVRLMGYAQPTFIATAESNRQPYKVPSFFVRRARADFKAEFDSLYTLFFEFDAGPPGGTSLVEGYSQAALIRDHLNFRLGKFIQPFSAENMRSSRALETVERFQALNAFIGLPALDAQNGAMLFGTVDAGKMFKYYLSINNGTNTASQTGNVKDNNADKDYIGRLEFTPSKVFRAGLGLDYATEVGQTLTLRSYSGAAYDTIRVQGIRQAIDVDLHGTVAKIGLDAEWLMAMFPDTNASMHGGYVQAGMWVKGSEADGGIQPLVRVEYSTLSADNVPGPSLKSEVSGAMLMSYTLGLNYWMNQWTRWQVNLIEETTSGKGNGVFAAKDNRFLPTLFAQMQIKF
ncbi:MAG: porin [Fibrobacteria bacterium]